MEPSPLREAAERQMVFEPLRANVEMFEMARDTAALLGRRPAPADEYRRLIGKPAGARDCRMAGLYCSPLDRLRVVP